MGRKKQMIKQIIAGQKAKERQESKEKKLDPLSKEEHQKRLAYLKSLGLIK